MPPIISARHGIIGAGSADAAIRASRRIANAAAFVFRLMACTFVSPLILAVGDTGRGAK